MSGGSAPGPPPEGHRPPDPAPTGSAPASSLSLASGKLIRDEPRDGVTRLRIANAERRGALDHEILDALAETVASLDARCLVITGSEGMFSAGYDLGNLDGQEFRERAERLVAHPFHEALKVLAGYRFPVVGALNGHAIGGGLELALTCDIRIAARGIKLAMPPAKLGLIYSHTGLRKFLELCGPAHTAELFYVGRNIDADRGERIGLVSHVVEPENLEQGALCMAAEIAANAPLSVAGNKQVLGTLRAYDGALPEDVEQRMVALRESCFETEDLREGVRAFAEKRAPEWKGR